MFAGLAAAAMLASACGSSSASPTAAPTVASSAAASVGPTASLDTTPRGGTVVERLSADISSWDPCVVPGGTVPGTMGDVLNAVYGALVYTDVNGVVQPAMAASLTTTDAITWTFRLRRNVKFADGTAYDAAAVKYNFDRAADPANACTSQEWVSTWQSVTVVDPLTLTVTLPSPDANFDLRIAESAAFVASPTALRAASGKSEIRPVGAGPFRLVGGEVGTSEILARNPGYWDQPRPYIDTLELMTVPDSNAAQAMVVAGSLDFMIGYRYQYGSNATKPGVTTRQVPVDAYNIAYFVTSGGTTGLFNDPLARRAVVVGVDRDKWVQALTQDASSKAPATLYSGTSPYFDSTLAYPAYDGARAQLLINQVIGQGKKFAFTILVPNSLDALRAAEFLRQSMAAYKGVTVNVNTVAPGLYSQECLAAHGDICIQPGASTWNGPEPYTYDLLSSTGALPFSAYRSTAMDAALRATQVALTTAQKVAAYRDVQKVFMLDLPLVQYGQQTRWMLLRNTVAGFVHAGQGQVQAQYLYRCAGSCGPQPSAS